MSDVLPSFSHAADSELACAASEPFLNKSEFIFLSSQPLEDRATPVSAGTAYLSEDGPRYGFMLGNNVEQPLREVELFMSAYDSRIGALHRKIARVTKQLPEAIPGFEKEAERLVAKSSKAGLSTLAAFAILEGGKTSADSILVFTKVAGDELPLENRERAQKVISDPLSLIRVRSMIEGLVTSPDAAIAYTNHRIMTNASPSNYAIIERAITRYLPPSDQAKLEFSKDERIGDFFSLSRKERRKRLATERKQAG